MPNFLSNEDSPYLQQHKDNLVHWYPWCDEAFLKAKKENKPIFISIGYSACHWCHVMEHEVFENRTLAQKLNKDFICIKVDREERPDIDKFYQELHRLLNQRSGGWPISVFSTPDNKPFFAGTYIPAISKQDMIGFGDLINMIALKISENDSFLLDNAHAIQKHLKPSSHPSQVAHIDERMVQIFLKQSHDSFDENFGGFGSSLKFPQTSTLKSLLDIALINKDDTAMHILTHTLDSMVQGGLYDRVDSGFCRYSRSNNWLIPHFEKMTYDNALFIELYTLAYKHTKNQAYLDIAKETSIFMLEKMSHNKLFYSSSDAYSDGVEGKYFLFNYDETMRYFKQHGFKEDEAIEIFSHLHITPVGNFSDENGFFHGSSIIRLEADVPKGYDKAIKLLKEIRSSRQYPFIDKKIITAWNAMMVKSLFILSNYEAYFKEIAIKHLEALLNKLYKDKHLFHTAIITGQAKIDAFLEDYAYLCTALIEAYQSTLDRQYLQLAQELADKALNEFFEAGKWFFSKDEFVTDADIADSSYPGSVSVIIDALLSLGVLIDVRYRNLAFMSLEYYSAQLVTRPIHYPYLFNQAFRYIKEDRIIKGNEKALHSLQDAYFELHYPFMHRDLRTEAETLLCGVQSCFTTLKDDSDLVKELNKTL